MNRENVIKGLEHCKKYGSLGGNNCDGYYEYTNNLQEIIKANSYRKDCPYGQCRTGCIVTLIDDTIALLKEQEIGHWVASENCSNAGIYCSECSTKIFDHYPMKKKLSYFCPHCGTRMEGEIERR